MDRYALEGFATGTLISQSKDLLDDTAQRTADLIARFAEIDRRGAFADAGYRSMHEFCVTVFRLDDGAAYRRITAARHAAKFPALFHAVADGRLHLTAVIAIGPHLNADNVDEMIAAATHRTRREIEAMLVARVPKPDLRESLRRLPARPVAIAAAPGQANGSAFPIAAQDSAAAPSAESSAAIPTEDLTSLAPARVMSSPAPARVTPPAPARVTPLSPARFGLQVTIDQSTHDKLRRAQEIMSHSTRPHDLAKILDRALDVLIEQLERRKLAAAKKPRGSRTASRHVRSVPADVKRAVRARDGDRCAYVANDGRRCDSRARLEFDHVVPVARGGTSTIANVRQLCRTHNRLAAERKFGRAYVERRVRAAIAERRGSRSEPSAAFGPTRFAP